MTRQGARKKRIVTLLGFLTLFVLTSCSADSNRDSDTSYDGEGFRIQFPYRLDSFNKIDGIDFLLHDVRLSDGSEMRLYEGNAADLSRIRPWKTHEISISGWQAIEASAWVKSNVVFEYAIFISDTQRGWPSTLHVICNKCEWAHAEYFRQNIELK